MAWIVPLLPLLVVPVLAVLGRGRARGDGGRGDDREPVPGPSRLTLAVVAAGAMVGTAALASLAAVGGWTGRLAWNDVLVLTLDYGLESAPASALLAVLVPVVAAPVLAYAAYHEDGRGLARLLAVLAFFVAAMEVVAGAADLLALLIGWELIGACSAVLVSHEWWEAGKPRAATAVFLTTRAGDLGLFLALAAAFAGAASLEYGALHGLEGLPLQLLVGGILVAAAAKSAQLPFAPWLFAAMEGPVSVSTLLHAATMVASGAFLLIRLHPVLDAVAWFGPAALAVGLGTAIVGGTVALLQPHAKRLLAGSTSAHYGLMFAAAGAGYPAVAALHLVAHAFAKAPLFLTAGIAHDHAGSYRLWRLGLGKALPAVAVASALAAAALAGIPPLGAAWSKEMVVTAAGHAAPWVALLAAVAGALSAAYMARFQLQAFGWPAAGRVASAAPGEPREPGKAGGPGGPGKAGAAGSRDRRSRAPERWALYLLAAVTVALALLWLPGVHDGAGHALPGELPTTKAWELIVSLGLVALGLAGGAAVARRRPGLGEEGAAAGIADWVWLPGLARQAVVRPARAVARALAHVDDAVVDGAVRAVPAAARGLSRGIDLFDDRIVDGAVRVVAGAGVALAALGRRLLERVMDGVPEGTSRLIGRAGSAVRRLQTGLAHHYYRVLVAGLVLVVALLLLGG